MLTDSPAAVAAEGRAELYTLATGDAELFVTDSAFATGAFMAVVDQLGVASAASGFASITSVDPTNVTS